ncbi:MAG: phage portal protein [Synergistaceae bacterium]|nr:phage portal protein [Synergistaceae bacterium]
MSENITLLKGKDTDLPVSLKIAEDPFEGAYGGGVLKPPYDLDFLARQPEYSNILGQCVEAMVTNIDGFGFTLEPVGNTDPENDGVPTKEAEEERKSILNFFEFCNQDLPYSQLRRRVRRDLEVLGNAYWEIIRDGKGDIAWIEHIEGHTMRLTKLDADYTPVTYLIRDDASNELKPYESRKRFRRFVQIRNNIKTYFKEFGDPRYLDARTGEYVSESKIESADFIPATEIIHFKLYCPYSPYGVPRWIGNLLAVQGSRQAEEVNYEYFENNTIPPLALLVAGKLSDKTVSVLEDFVNDHMRGRKGFNKMLIVQANPSGSVAPDGKTPPVSLHFEHLGDVQHSDSLFNNYDAVNREKVRSSFRLPPVFVGLTGDYTRATARESREVAEEQVFAPERADHDFVINRLLFPAMSFEPKGRARYTGVRYWRYKSLAPSVNNSESMSGVLSAFCNCGLTVREAREEISRLLNHPLTAIEDESAASWLDLPLSVYLAKLQAGEFNNESGAVELAKSAGSQDKEALLLKAMLGIEEALSEEHEHGSE